MLRSLLVESGQSVARSVPELKRALSAAEAQKTFWRRQGHGSAQTGGAVVLDVADAAAARTQGSPSHAVVAV
jgi:hypothetical protein